MIFFIFIWTRLKTWPNWQFLMHILRQFPDICCVLIMLYCLPSAFSLDGSGLSFADLFRLVAFCCISRWVHNSELLMFTGSYVVIHVPHKCLLICCLTQTTPSIYEWCLHIFSKILKIREWENWSRVEMGREPESASERIIPRILIQSHLYRYF